MSQPTPRTDAFAFNEERRCQESGVLFPPADTDWLEFCRILERELAEKDAQILALREALQPHFNEMERRCIAAELRGLKQTSERNRKHPRYISAKKALSTAPPPVVPLEDVRTLAEALQRYAESERWILEDAEWRFVDDPKSSWFSPHELAEKAVSTYTAKHPIQ